jgi:hypothetical protein
VAQRHCSAMVFGCVVFLSESAGISPASAQAGSCEPSLLDPDLTDEDERPGHDGLLSRTSQTLPPQSVEQAEDERNSGRGLGRPRLSRRQLLAAEALPLSRGHFRGFLPR